VQSSTPLGPDQANVLLLFFLYWILNSKIVILGSRGLMKCLFVTSDPDVPWAKFQPRIAKPRSEPGQLYFPAAYTHVFMKYWDYVNDPVQHPDCCETEFAKDAMTEIASALSRMDLSHFEPLVDAEAPDKACRTAFLAATSRKCQIQDATDYWNQGPGQEEAGTVSGGSALGQDSHNVDT
jgi:hypothetical protein